MLIQESFKDVPTQDGGSMRIFTFHPQIPNYPKAKFPGVVVFSEIYQGEYNRCILRHTHDHDLIKVVESTTNTTPADNTQ